MNKVVLIGRLTKDPELKFTPSSGIAVSHFNLAVDRNYIGEDGKRPVDFIPIVCWRKLAETAANNLSKGRLVAVSGSIQTRKYTAQDGTNRYITEVVAEMVQFLDKLKNNNQEQATYTDNTNNNYDGTGFFPVENTDDIPF
ncbi:single-strand binding protein [Caloramator quimbayensis]|uniref:Single-stranded DNA-binding protein n=1 Tax=Caloramator quimbayensis TaxID=1147123 RepID=A0A1T4YGZ3_9CLOT|nr:single-stranded DNA-binding protein [Caloramator quimbayensis]SKB01039.1 single-strand binding protein [Caloramator quimbayensis]